MLKFLKKLNLLPINLAMLALYQVDPFLKLVDDCKLEAVHGGSDQLREAYGSQSDDENALKSLSMIEVTGNQSKESFATMIMKALEKSSDVTIALLPETQSNSVVSLNM